uniref:Uncharacterized protein n=1 Tax=Arundo donax TaxID=35708 RepID=A0A0A9GHX4_ARUDO
MMPCPRLGPFLAATHAFPSLSSLFGHGSLEMSALGRARTHLHKSAN